MARYLGGLITKDESLVLPANNFEDTSAPGVWTLEEAQALNKQGLWPTAGVSNPAKFVENIFSCDTYDGNGGTQTITNDINLSGEGGLVWLKSRSNAFNHILFNTVGGATYRLYSNTTDVQDTMSNGLTAFNSNGFDLGDNVDANGNGLEFVSWTWRKASKFFDVVQYSGTGSARTVSHSLGSVPGMIMIKNLSQSDNWAVYHRGADSSAPEDKYLILNTNAAVADSANWWNDTAPTSSVFTVGTDHSVNASGENYVAYLFGHDTSSDGMIQCGSYDGNGSSNDSGTKINLGFEPQWVMIKRINNVSNWHIFDTLRGIATKKDSSDNGQDAYLYANDTAVETDDGNYLNVTSTGFQLETGDLQTNGSGQKYIYMAIRKAPMQTPTSRSSVFYVEAKSQGGTSTFTTGFPVDFLMNPARLDSGTATDNFPVASRLQGGDDELAVYMSTRDNTVENSGSSFGFALDHPNKYIMKDVWNSSTAHVGYAWRRAPKFMDVVTYVGTGSVKTESHNLGVAPEMMWIKSRSHAYDWIVYYGDATDYLKLNTTAATADDNTYWNDTAPTSTVFTVGTQVAVNINTGNFVAYLFATLAGISKIGTFSHTSGSSTDVDCGFSSGSSFVMVKRINNTGEWFVWDSARGIVSGNDPRLTMNGDAIEVTNTDFIDPLNSGFQLGSAMADGSYVFYAIAA